MEDNERPSTVLEVIKIEQRIDAMKRNVSEPGCVLTENRVSVLQLLLSTQIAMKIFILRLGTREILELFLSLFVVLIIFYLLR